VVQNFLVIALTLKIRFAISFIFVQFFLFAVFDSSSSSLASAKNKENINKVVSMQRIVTNQ
jgi:hypothetical protein